MSLFTKRFKINTPKLLSALAFSLLTDICLAQTPPAAVLEEIDPGLRKIVTQAFKAEIIAEGFDWSEGPLWVESKQMLLFSDVPKNIIYKWTSEKGKEIYLSPSGYTGTRPRGGEPGSNGLLLNPKGQLVLCQHGDRKMAMMDASLDHPLPKFVTLADNYRGKKFDSPNDAAYHPNGTLYFTDPPYGLERNIRDSSKAAPYQGVYKLSKNGHVDLLADTMSRPNGIAIFPGGKRILIANSDRAKPFWYVYELDTEGRLIKGKIFSTTLGTNKADRGLPDGLKIDKQGNVFASGPGGIWIFNQDGRLLGKIRVPSLVSNCALSADGKTLFLTADMNVLRIRLR